MRKIVVGVDGSATSDAAFRWAAQEAEAHHATLVAVHAWTYPYFSVAFASEALQNDYETLKLAAKKLLHDAAGRALATGELPFLYREHVVFGGPANALLDEAQDADLLVVGSRRLGTFGRLVLGSVSSVCVRDAVGPVVVVPAPADGEPGPVTQASP